MGRSGFRDLPLVIDALGRFYFKGEGDNRLWVARTTKPQPSLVTPPRKRLMSRRRSITCSPSSTGRSKRSSENGRVSELHAVAGPRLRLRSGRAGLLLVRGAGRLRHPDCARGISAGSGAIARRRARAVRQPHRPATFAPRSVALAPLVGLRAGQGIDAVVLGVAAMALDPMPFDAMRRRASISCCHSSAFLTGFLSASASRSAASRGPTS